jgi:hypothetical protein
MVIVTETGLLQRINQAYSMVLINTQSQVFTNPPDKTLSIRLIKSFNGGKYEPINMIKVDNSHQRSIK